MLHVIQAEGQEENWEYMATLYQASSRMEIKNSSHNLERNSQSTGNKTNKDGGSSTERSSGRGEERHGARGGSG